MRQFAAILAVCVVAMLASPPGHAQDAARAGADDETETGAETRAESAMPDDEGDDNGASDTDETDPGSYLDIEEDDFRPSEEIPADQSIDFPTDI